MQISRRKMEVRGEGRGDGHPAVESPVPGEKYVSLADTDQEGGGLTSR